MKKILFVIFLFTTTVSFAETGPVLNPLKVQYMYTQGSIYVRFSDGAMPGCHGNNSGRLYDNLSRFDEVYSQLLTMVAVKGIKGQVLYNIDNPGAGQWSDCIITGLVIMPK